MPSSSSVMSSSSSEVPTEDTPWVIEKIGCTDPDDYTGQATTFFDGSGGFTGSFFDKQYSSGEYANLSGASQVADYYLGSNRIAADAGCNGRSIHTGTWLKKYRDTDNQHSNGFNTGLNRSFGDIETIVLELRINSDKTDIPTFQELEDKYASTLTGTDGVARLDKGKVVFGLTLGNPDANDNSIRGEMYIEIDQDMYADQWVRVTVPKDQMFFWRGAPWVKEPVSLSEANSAQAGYIYLNPETKGTGQPQTYGNVVRDIYGYSKWTEQPPNPMPQEDFKEMNISIRTFEVRYDVTNPDMGGGNSSSQAAASSSSQSNNQGSGGQYTEDFSGGQLPSWMDFADCGNGNSTANISGGKLEISAGSSCGGWAKLSPIDSMSSAYIKFDATAQSANGNNWFVLIGNGNALSLSEAAIRLRPQANERHLTWNVGNNGDTFTPNFYEPGGTQVTAPFPLGNEACFEIFYDNSAQVIRLWKDGALLEGLELTGSSPSSSYQQRWYNDHGGNFTPNVKHIYLGSGQAGVKTSFDNVVISQSRIGCN